MIKSSLSPFTSLATPWFNQPGGGVQKQFGESIKNLAKNDPDAGIKAKIKLLEE